MSEETAFSMSDDEIEAGAPVVRRGGVRMGVEDQETGVGGDEIMFYNYWCLEKGYAAFTGPRNGTPEWANRARGCAGLPAWRVRERNRSP